MRMMYAIEIMSRNREGYFQWTEQLVSILNAMGDLSVNEKSSVTEILEAVERLEPDVKSTLFGISVNFKEDFKDIVLKEDGIIGPKSNKAFYSFTTAVLIGTMGLIWYSGNSDIEPETLKVFTDFALSVLKMFQGASS